MIFFFLLHSFPSLHIGYIYINLVETLYVAILRVMQSELWDTWQASREMGDIL